MAKLTDAALYTIGLHHTEEAPVTRLEIVAEATVRSITACFSQRPAEPEILFQQARTTPADRINPRCYTEPENL